ncbi:hypothetical protein ACX3V1_10080, partial [Escherichia coli]
SEPTRHLRISYAVICCKNANPEILQQLEAQGVSILRV